VGVIFDILANLALTLTPSDCDRIALVELTCPWDTDAKRAEERKTTRYADLKNALSNEGWDCSLYLIKVGVRGHIVKSVKDSLWLLFQA
jgi:hypothetical protein